MLSEDHADLLYRLASLAVIFYGEDLVGAPPGFDFGEVDAALDELVAIRDGGAAPYPTPVIQVIETGTVVMSVDGEPSEVEVRAGDLVAVGPPVPKPDNVIRVEFGDGGVASVMVDGVPREVEVVDGALVSVGTPVAPNPWVLADDAIRAGHLTADEVPAAPPSLRDRAANWLEVSHDYWQAMRVVTGGAVVWVTDHSGAMVIYTRGEYAEQLRSALPVEGDSAPLFFAAGDSADKEGFNPHSTDRGPSDG